MRHFIFASLILALVIQFALASNVVDLTSSNFDEKVMKSDAVWVVAFIAPWCGHCQRLHPEYEKAADSLGGVVNIGKINCDDEQQLAQRFGIRGFPTIKVFGYGKDAKNSPKDYQYERSAKAIVDFALSEFNAIADPVSGLSNQAVADTFLNGNQDKAKALLFTSKNSNPSLWKSLALDFKGKLEFAFVPDSNKDLASKFGVEKAPKVFVIPAGASSIDAKVAYTGAVKKADLTTFLSKYSTVAKPAGAEQNQQEDEPQKPSQVFSARAPPSFNAEAVELTTQKQLDETCAQMCIIGVVKSDDDKKLLDSFAANYAKQLRFTFVRAGKQDGFIESFKTTLTENVDASKPGLDLIVLRAGKKKFARVEHVEETTAPYILERVLYGGIRFSNLATIPQVFEHKHEEL